ncbi:MAG: LamG-like jellyroll fold domain-containing protein, partial [Limisphaerales bacterium]
HTLIVYGVSPPLQIQDVNYSAVGTTTQTYYIRQMNSDEYNAAPGWYRGSSTNPNNRPIANYVRFENVQPEGGVITLNVEVLTPGFERNTGPAGIQLLLNAASAGTPPTVTASPQPTVAAIGGTARLTVTATGDNLTYQWRKNGRNIPNGGNITGATTSTLVINDFTEADAAVYSVAVFNSAGSVISGNAALGVSEFSIADRLVGHWKFDETTGTVAANSVTGGAPGEVIGTATWGAGKIANALTLDGGTYVLITNYTKARAAISGSAWVNVADGSAGDIALFRNAQGLMTVSGGAGRIVGQFEVGLNYDDTTGVLLAEAAVGIGPNIARATATAAFTTGVWHHIAYSADGAQLRVYVDGQQVAVVDYFAEINPPNINYISVGAILNTDVGDPTSLILDPANPNVLIGKIDDLAVWTRGLSANEISKIYTAGNAGQSLSTVVIDPPEEDVELNVSRTGDQLTISWTGSGYTLQSSDNLTTWSNVAGVTGTSYTTTTSAPARFYQLIRN